MATLVKRKDIVLFINTAKDTADPTWSLYGNKSTSATYSYNPSSTSETYIVDDNATVTLDAYNVSIDGNMKCYHGDAVYDFINELRYNLAVGDDAKCQVLLIDKYDLGEDNSAKAQVFDATISIESYGGDGGVTPTITFTIGLNGTPKNGTATFAGNVPTFVEEV